MTESETSSPIASSSNGSTSLAPPNAPAERRAYAAPARNASAVARFRIRPRDCLRPPPPNPVIREAGDREGEGRTARPADRTAAGTRSRDRGANRPRRPTRRPRPRPTRSRCAWEACRCPGRRATNARRPPATRHSRSTRARSLFHSPNRPRRRRSCPPNRPRPSRSAPRARWDDRAAGSAERPPATTKITSTR